MFSSDFSIRFQIALWEKGEQKGCGWDTWPRDLRASLCKILISSFAHKMDLAHNFPVGFF